MNIKERRKAQLLLLLEEFGGKGKKKLLAEKLRKRPAQVSQWLSGYRTISEESAREIEARSGKPTGWLDTDANPSAPAAPESVITPKLDQALSVVADAIGGITAGRWTMVRARLDELAGRPELHDDVLADVLPLLQPAHSKQRATA